MWVDDGKYMELIHEEKDLTIVARLQVIPGPCGHYKGFLAVVGNGHERWFTEIFDTKLEGIQILNAVMDGLKRKCQICLLATE